MGGRCPNSLVVKHVLGKDESQVRFLLRAPHFASATLRVASHTSREGMRSSVAAQQPQGYKTGNMSDCL